MPFKRKAMFKFNPVVRSAKRIKTASGLVRSTGQSTIFAKAPGRVELKYDDGGSAVFSVLTAGALVLLSTIPNGTGPSERVGRAITYHDITVNYKVQPRNDTDLGGIRVLLVYDRQTNGVSPVITDIMTATNTLALYNANNRSRFKILYDRTHSSYYEATVAGAGGRQSAPVHVINKNISLKGLRAHFLNIGAGIADIESGAIYMVVLTDINDANDFTETNRIQYTDL